MGIATAKKTQRLNAPLSSSVEKYLHKTLAQIQLYDAYHNRTEFREAFKQAHGREPYANPMIRFKWSLGAQLTPSDYQTAVSEREVFRTFLREHVFDQNAIMVIPAGTPEVRYRDVYDERPQDKRRDMQGFTFSPEHMSFVAGLPELVVPIGQVPGVSPVTGAKVFEPVCVALLGAPRMEGEMMRVVEKVLRASGRPLEVKTGANAFAVENVE
ncbi:putative amidase [Septoria linicola]|nr:putative amidase [Septoria linicola]